MHSSKNYSLREKAVIEFAEEQQIILINELRFLCIICQTFGLAPIDTFPNAGDGLETWPSIRKNGISGSDLKPLQYVFKDLVNV